MYVYYKKPIISTINTSKCVLDFSINRVTDLPAHIPNAYCTAFDTDYEYDIGDTVYLLVYSYILHVNGKVFHNETEILWVFKDVDAAMDAAEVWKYTDSDFVSFISDSNEVITLNNPISHRDTRSTMLSVDVFPYIVN